MVTLRGFRTAVERGKLAAGACDYYLCIFMAMYCIKKWAFSILVSPVDASNNQKWSHGFLMF